MTPNLSEAIHLLGIYTADRFDLWLLAGKQKASSRAHILSFLTGENVPQSKAGVNALRDAFYHAMDVTGETPAEREDCFVAACHDSQGTL